MHRHRLTGSRFDIETPVTRLPGLPVVLGTLFFVNLVGKLRQIAQQFVFELKCEVIALLLGFTARHLARRGSCPMMRVSSAKGSSSEKTALSARWFEL